MGLKPIATVKFLFANPLCRVAEERVDQRSAVGVSNRTR